MLFKAFKRIKMLYKAFKHFLSFVIGGMFMIGLLLLLPHLLHHKNMSILSTETINASIGSDTSSDHLLLPIHGNASVDTVKTHANDYLLILRQEKANNRIVLYPVFELVILISLTTQKKPNSFFCCRSEPKT